MKVSFVSISYMGMEQKIQLMCLKRYCINLLYGYGTSGWHETQNYITTYVSISYMGMEQNKEDVIW